MRPTSLIRPIHSVFLALLCFPATVSLCAGEPERLPRKGSFLGVHFDFHATKADRNIGENTTPEMIEKIIDMIGPDFIQVDAKGHPGVSSYPTKAGFHPADGVVGDPLRTWREVTARRGVALYAHYSALEDKVAVEKHPEWAYVDEKGGRSRRLASVFSPLADKLLIPQLLELAADYKLDGVWIDGGVWRASVDFSEAAKKAFTRKTGIETIPLSHRDANWADWMRFQREAYRDYMRHVIGGIREKAPGFQIADNWAFANHMAEPVSFDVDYLSGDVSGADNYVNHIRLSSRLMASHGLPWDLMSWCFYKYESLGVAAPDSQKTAAQLKREAACVIAQGGGHQVYFTQSGPGSPPRRDGSVDLEKLRPMAEVARFCRERQEICFKASAIPQIAVFHSTEASYRKLDKSAKHRDGFYRLFDKDATLHGIVSALLENQYCVEVLLRDKLTNSIGRYPLVVICEWDYIEPEVRAVVARHVENGGKLLLVGQEAVRLFEKELAAAAGKSLVDVPLPYSMILFKVGKGSVGVIPHSVSAEYAANPAPALRELVGTAARTLFPDPIVTVTGSNDIDVSLMRTAAGKLAIHLVNTSGPHRTAGKIETIAPVGPLQVTIRCDRKPSRITLQPAGKALDFACADGKARVKVDSVPIHEILLIE